MDERSLCYDCPIKDECKTSSMPGIVVGCGKRSKYEAEGPKERHEAPEQPAEE